MENLKKGDKIDNATICKIFKCSPQGGMRKSNKTKTLVLVSNHVKSIYQDKWIGNVLHYTGMGSNGDQSLNFMQNKTLSESRSNGITVHLFEVYSKQEYTYQGVVELIDTPYVEHQLDTRNVKRTVWVFPLIII